MLASHPSANTMLFVFFVTNIIHLTIGCKWQKIHDDAACFLLNKGGYGEHFTKDSCLSRCSKEEVTYCSFVEGFIIKLYLAGCTNQYGCCIGSDQCEETVSGGNADVYECVPTQRPTAPPTQRPTQRPTAPPTERPTARPTQTQTTQPTRSTLEPTNPPTLLTSSPTISPSRPPSKQPSLHPSDAPTYPPTRYPTRMPSIQPIYDTSNPTNPPSIYPTLNPSVSATFDRTHNPFLRSTHYPTRQLTEPTQLTIVIFVCLFLCVLAFCVYKCGRKSMCKRDDKDKFMCLIHENNPRAKPIMNEVQIIGLSIAETPPNQRAVLDNDPYKSIRQKHDELLKMIHAHYNSVQQQYYPFISLDFIQNLLNIHHDILSDEQYESFMFQDNHLCGDEHRVSFKTLFKAIKEVTPAFECDNELIARCEILDTIHSSHTNEYTRMGGISNERCRRYSQLHQTTEFRAEQFDLGRKFIYHEDNEQKQSISVGPKPKFDNLKDELINNDIVQRHKASCYRVSYFMRKLCDHKKTQIAEECVLVLVTYCNLDTFQREYSKTYREWEKHGNFFYFGKILKQAVLGFGRTVREGPVKQFYHGVSEVLVPSEIVGDLCEGISIYGPLSASSSFPVATRFAGKGIIMTLGGSHSDAKCFAVYALSDYPHEHEHLFLQNDAKIELLNIHLVSTGEDYGFIIQQLKTFDAIMYQSIYGKTVHFNMGRSDIACRLKGIQEMRSKPKQSSAYAHELIDVHFEKKRKLIIHYSVLRKCYRDLFDLFCDSSWIKVKQLMIVFPNIEDITIKGISLSDSIMKDIYETHRMIFDPNTNDSYTWKLKRMTLYVKIQQSSLKASDAVLKYNGRVAQKNTVQLDISQQKNRDDTMHHILIIDRKVQQQSNELCNK